MSAIPESFLKKTAALSTEVTQPFPNSRKIYITGSRPDLKVGMREIHQTNNNPPLRVYDTSGPYTDPAIKTDVRQGLQKIRAEWIQKRKNRNDKNFSQMHYARQGIITEEMEYIAIRENVKPEFVVTK